MWYSCFNTAKNIKNKIYVCRFKIKYFYGTIVPN